MPYLPATKQTTDNAASRTKEASLVAIQSFSVLFSMVLRMLGKEVSFFESDTANPLFKMFVTFKIYFAVKELV